MGLDLNGQPPSCWLLCLLSLSPHRAHHAMSHLVYRIFEVKHQHRKVENQIKMAKMVLMNELNKQANVLIEELEVYVDRWASGWVLCSP